MNFSPNTLHQCIPRPTARFLFHHYVTITAPIMAPAMLASNPWDTIFPASALKELPDYATPEQAALYYAVLAHAATHIVQLSGPGVAEHHMSVIATQYHTLAIENLQYSIDREQREYGPFVAAILTLMLVEVKISSPSSPHLRFVQSAYEFAHTDLRLTVRTLESPPWRRLELHPDTSRTTALERLTTRPVLNAPNPRPRHKHGRLHPTPAAPQSTPIASINIPAHTRTPLHQHDHQQQHPLTSPPQNYPHNHLHPVRRRPPPKHHHPLRPARPLNHQPLRIPPCRRPRLPPPPPQTSAHRPARTSTPPAPPTSPRCSVSTTRARSTAS